MGYKYQAKATRKFGIEFRSQLEAKWAYWFSQNHIEWDYSDQNHFDFLACIQGVELKLEIKPKGDDFRELALSRLETGMDFICLVQGDPHRPLLSGMFICLCGELVMLDSFSGQRVSLMTILRGMSRVSRWAETYDHYNAAVVGEVIIAYPVHEFPVDGEYLFPDGFDYVPEQITEEIPCCCEVVNEMLVKEIVHFQSPNYDSL